MCAFLSRVHAAVRARLLSSTLEIHRRDLVLLPGALKEGGGGWRDGHAVVCVCVCVGEAGVSLTELPSETFSGTARSLNPSVTPSTGSVVYNPPAPPQRKLHLIGPRCTWEAEQAPALIGGISFEPLHVGRTLQFAPSSMEELFRSSLHIPWIFFPALPRKSNAISQHPVVNPRSQQGVYKFTIKQTAQLCHITVCKSVFRFHFLVLSHISQTCNAEECICI